MKKALLLLAAMTAMSGAFAQGWQKPVYSGNFQPLTAGDTVYIYNTEAQQFLTEGNDWGTHGTVGDTGLLFVVNQYVEEGKEWDGETYTIRDESVAKSGWYNLFINAEGIYVDRSSQEDYFFSFRDMGRNTYQIYGAAINPTYNATGEMEGYMLGRYTDYTNARDGIWTGTGVIYDYYGTDNNYEAGQFQALWAFISQADYATYQQEVARYGKSVEFKALIDEATTYGVDVSEANAAYANTSATVEELEAAIAALNAKILAYYEQTVTPDNPVIIKSDDCSTTDTWTNAANATTFELASMADWQVWEEGAYEGSYLNLWSAAFNGRVYQSLSGLPNGIYVVNISAMADKQVGVVYANDNQKKVPADSYGRAYTITTEVTDGQLEYGYMADGGTENWVTIDNATVKYYGTGWEAYRYWLQSLMETANFEDVTVQDSLIEEYQKVLQPALTATTKEEVLAIIPQYEAILNEINLNIAAYQTLGETIAAANEMGISEGINEHYGDLLSDAVMLTAQPIVEEHKLGTEAVQAATAELQAIIDEAQNYLWKMESLTSEMENAATVYEEFKDACAPSAADAYNAFVEKYKGLETATLTLQDVLNLLDELYAIEFNLQVPDQPASDDNPVDYTAKIQYPSFDGGATGWTNDGWSTCGTNTWNSFADGEVLDQLYLNLWNMNNARVYQTVSNLPAGTYILQISAFANGAGLQVYANNDCMDVVVGQNNEEGSEYYGVARIFGETTETHEGEVWYGNIYRITTLVGEDGILEVGVRNVGDGEIWAMVDNVKLTYYGASSSKTPTDITALDSRSAQTNSRIYNMAGQQVNESYKGIVVKNGKKFWQK